MHDTLTAIDRWLAQHAAKILQYSLNPPAELTALHTLEQLSGFALPQSFNTLYQWHNGLDDQENIGNLCYGMSFLSLEQMSAYREEQKDLYGLNFELEHCDVQIKSDNAHHLGWLKFAENGARTGLYLDFDPTAQGTIEQVIFVDHDFDIALVVADSVEHMMQQFLHDLQQGLYQLHPDALEDDQHFLEPDQQIDLMNWHKSERWSRPTFN